MASGADRSKVMETVKIVEVNSELASEWLKTNNFNRRLSQPIIRRYADDMLNGRWNFTGDSIKFNCDGTLLDGQHRLEAIIRSNTKQKFIVVRGLEKDTFFNLDIGKKRTFSDVLTIEDKKTYTAALAAAIRLCHSFDIKTVESNKYENNSSILYKYFEENPGIEKSLEYVINLDKEGKILKLSFLTAVHYILKRIAAKDADEFIKNVVTGENLDKTSPIYLLREKLIEIRFRKYRAENKMLFIMFFKAWNYYRRGDKPKNIRTNIKSKFVLPV